MLIYTPLVVAVVGGVLYLLVEKNGKVAELGRTMFACGVLVTLFQIVHGKPLPL